MTDSTAAALVQAGRELFGQEGFEAASVRAITRRAGANLGAITYHFGSKEALYRAVLARGLEPLAAGIEEVAAQPGASLDRIEWAVRLCWEYMTENPDVPRLLMQRLASGQPLPEPARTAFKRVLTSLADVIGEGQAAGEIRPADPWLAAVNVVAAPVHLSLRPRDPEAATDSEADSPRRGGREVNGPEEHAVAFVLGGLRAGKPRRGRKRRR